ncbi:MAG: hypothetical protein PHR87_09650 [Sulfurospirillaceae bacterium]|jgi:excinuclease UvrABC ATPase subunit|nr:hypothetical protein [Sulfurospirillum sp.]MDD3343825.1 hypothetical protein [Sulfurospirillaceae bacterium]
MHTETLFNATLVTDKGLIIEDVLALKVEEVIPFLKERYDIKEVIHFVISIGENIDSY